MENINIDNISFLLEDIEEKEDIEDNLDYTEDKLYSFIDDDDTNNQIHNINNSSNSSNNSNNSNNSNSSNNIKHNLIYYIEKSVFTCEDETYYNEKYTIKELMKICAYYGIDKDIKAAKCRKMDIIVTIVFFEAQPENAEIVSQRNNMWAYMTELATDPKMRKYLLWS
jgi:uncharacterized protein YjgD (DUF1641 family)